MRASWKKLVIVVIYGFSLWILFHLFISYWKQRRPASPHPMGMSIVGSRGVYHLLTPKILVAKSKFQLPKAVAWREGAHFADAAWKGWSARMAESKSVQCSGHFIGFQGQFARLSPVIIDGQMAKGPDGGEDISSVLNQPEHREFLEFKSGLFQLPCDETPHYSFKLGYKNHLNSYLRSLTCTKNFPYSATKLVGNKTVFVVTRYEYVNMYHSMTDFYNAFLNMAFLGLKPDDIVVLLADAHPKGGLDNVWSTLFHSYLRVGQLRRENFLVEDMVWVQMSYLSPLISHRLPAIPATEEYRLFFLSRYGVKSIDRHLNCSNIRVTFIWRRDYVAHPRNPSGHVVRKIKNEGELIAEVRHEIPVATVRGSQIDLLPMHQQLQMIVDTDILIGMHGAGLTHGMFLPKHAGIVELYPTYWSEGNAHFKKIAQWRHLHYQRWVNHNPRLELAKHFTRIPPGVVSSMIRQVLHGMRCTIHKH